MTNQIDFDTATGQSDALSAGASNEVKAPESRKDSVAREILHSGLFDAAYYLEQCAGEIPTGIDPIEHYIMSGCSAGLNPNPWFESEYYLKANKDVAMSGLNPLLHFARYGWKELRSPAQESYDLIWHSIAENAEAFGAVNPMTRHCKEYADSLRGVTVRRIKPLSSSEATIFSQACHSVLSDKQLGARALRQIGNYCIRSKIWATAEEVFRSLIAIHPDVLSYRIQLADTVEKQGRVWQLVDVLNDAVSLAPEDADLWFRLGDAQERMGAFSAAASGFARALDIKASDAIWHYRLGYVLERTGRRASAKASYAKAAELDRTHNAARFGVGAFHQSRGFWRQAADAYAASTVLRPDDSELWFKLGFARDRCYQWQEAQHAFAVSVSLHFAQPYGHYRLGFVLERQGKWREAAGAYRTAADMSAEHNPYWYYRCGYVLERAGEFKEACAAYILTAKTSWDSYKKLGATFYTRWFPDSVDDSKSAAEGHIQTHAAPIADTAPSAESARREYLNALPAGVASSPQKVASHFYAVAELMQAHGLFDQALESYQIALDTSPQHKPAWYRALGCLLIRKGDYSRACEVFSRSRILNLSYGVDFTKYEADSETKQLMEYCQYFENRDVERRTILYESFFGASIGCNPLAIFRHIIGRPEFSEWKHIWVINDRSNIPAELARYPNVVFIPRHSDAYRRYVATAEYLLNNVTFPYWFIRRPDQKYLNTWHGTPLKTLGKDMKAEFMAHGNVTRNFLHATHLLSPNIHTSDIMMKSYDVAGIFAGKFAETGYPRVDHVIGADIARKQKIFEALGLKPGAPVVLYAPTWRGTQGKPETDCERILADVSALISDDYQLVFRGHHFMEAALAGVDLAISVASQEIDSCDLLSVVDVLVTDYSSIFFDFLPTGRPIVFYAYDVSSYAADRGFYFEISDLPGALCTDVLQAREAVARGLRNVADNTPEYQAARSRFCPHEDGNSARRAVEFLFFDSDESVVSRYQNEAESIVMYNGMFPPNGITSSYLNLLHSLESEGLQVSTLFDPAKITNDPVRVEKFESMPSYVKCIAREGRMVMDPEEIWVTQRLETGADVDGREQWSVYWKAYQREYRRIFGDAKHRSFVNFEGYNTITAAIGAAAPSGVHTAMYLHNDMIRERDTKLPYLDRLFKLYARYDKIVSVSEAMKVANREKLCRELKIEPAKFVSCDNTIDIGTINALSHEKMDLDLLPWFGGGATFVSLGRMSPEKDHAKLIRAFALVLVEYPDAKLVILGDGPLRHDLNVLIKDLNVTGSVKLAGLRMNPFPAMRACDCFVLSSNHEGQPMVLLEAMTMGVAIIATDIDGSRGLLGRYYGELVENSESGLSAGMLAFLKGAVKPGTFKADHYQANALQDFRHVTLSS
ncbi:CDP-glycerol glycerophosphotransferase family protein [Methylorubrum extorquens]|uniref:CDP-glycerol glycerophosphotransferase family protein n=1 Tax=Methylorubrum extorquens TaxID=408 RepID=A0AAX3WG74_METEX|nr:CDP-glycerol glycerophosphotransferase family protein [Methylorubrum extorquens]WHQ69491.1 CDP-glycerol glycerophosphotransferase family protein [Methylorubrum extorquens]